MRTHTKEHFFKFMPVDTAMAVLQSSSLRYSAPWRFNDPFDHRVTFSFPFNQQEFTDALVNESLRVIFDESVQIPEPTEFGQMLLLTRRARSIISKEEITATIMSGALESGQLFKNSEQVLNETFTAFLAQSRVLCVTEELDNVVMWAHYASEHRGVCIKLQCVDEIDNTLLVARPVNYTTKYPDFPSLQNYAKHLTGEIPIDFAPLIYDHGVYTKHEDWGYEREWRVHVPEPHDQNQLGYSGWREDPKVFGALYLGCRISSVDTDSLLRIVDKKMPHMEVYRTTPSRTFFGIEHTRIR